MTTALLVIDVQRALSSGDWAAFDVGRVIDNINVLAARARDSGAPVVFVQHEEEGGPFAYGTERWELADGLVVSPDDILVRKTTTNSFHRTNLHEVLQSRGVGRLVVCGLQTDFCVDTTIRQSLPLGYRVIVAADAHSTVDGVLTARQVIDHHNHVFRNITSFGPVIAVTPTVEIAFDE